MIEWSIVFVYSLPKPYIVSRPKIIYIQLRLDAPKSDIDNELPTQIL